MLPHAKSTFIGCLLAAFAAASVLALLAYLRPAVLGQALVVSDPLEKADLIYVLAGDFFGSRVLLGADLGARGYAPRVLLSGGRYGDQYEGDMAANFAVEHGYSRSLFCPVRLDATSTIDEARAIGPVFSRMGARRIILVTSNFHSRRVALVFRLFLPGVHFRVEAAPDLKFDPNSWWKSQPGRDLLLSEYKKLLGTLAVRAVHPSWN
jgi:uncharacterized SAM-binding protein YcdF (DUF218 family)